MRAMLLLLGLGWCAGLAGGQDLVVPQGAAEMLLLHREPVDLPPEAAGLGIRGRVRYQIHVGADGRVKQAHLLDGHPLLADAARRAVLRYRFRPLAPHGRPAGWKSIIAVPVPTPAPSVQSRAA